MIVNLGRLGKLIANLICDLTHIMQLKSKATCC